jgi:hypothetical protein
VSLQYLNALLRNPTVEVFILVICSSNTSRYARTWRKAILKLIPDVALHVVAEKGSSRAHKDFRQLHVVVSKLHGPT